MPEAVLSFCFLNKESMTKHSLGTKMLKIWRLQVACFNPVLFKMVNSNPLFPSPIHKEDSNTNLEKQISFWEHYQHQQQKKTNSTMKPSLEPTVLCHPKHLLHGCRALKHSHVTVLQLVYIRCLPSNTLANSRE